MGPFNGIVGFNRTEMLGQDTHSYGNKRLAESKRKRKKEDAVEDCEVIAR